MTKIVIIHFQPLELYPPAQNTIHYLAGSKDISIDVFSFLPSGIPELFSAGVDNVQLHRYASWDDKSSSLKRYLRYIKFYTSVFLGLLKINPSGILYFETYSCLPAWLFYIFRGKKKSTRMLVHYHEYASPEEIRQSSYMVKALHRLEKKMYRKTCWLSHTNEERMNMFLQDIKPVIPPFTYVLPNWPPKSWIKTTPSLINEPVKVVYAGAVSLETMYIKEFAHWVEKQKGRVIWDIYTQQDSKTVESFFIQIGARNINIKGYIPYNKLPETLYNYHAGVILYKGHIPNYIYNAPNKLFEYLACGLDVWYPCVMKGGDKYQNKENYPGVFALDFDKLEEQQLEVLINRENRLYKESGFYYEKKLPQLAKVLLGKL